MCFESEQIEKQNLMNKCWFVCVQVDLMLGAAGLVGPGVQVTGQ